MNAPRRRGRPPANPIIAAEPAAETTTEAGAPTRRRKRGKIGGMSLKLDAPARPGFIRRWVNDQNNRLAETQELAYDFVTDQSIQSSGSDTRISRLVGTQANGEPLRAYLMETPEEEFAEGSKEKEAFNRRVDEAITTGSDFTGQMPSKETYGHGEITRDR